MILVEEREGQITWFNRELSNEEQEEVSESLWLNPELVPDEEIAGFWGSVRDCE